MTDLHSTGNDACLRIDHHDLDGVLCAHKEFFMLVGANARFDRHESQAGEEHELTCMRALQFEPVLESRWILVD